MVKEGPSENYLRKDETYCPDVLLIWVSKEAEQNLWGMIRGGHSWVAVKKWAVVVSGEAPVNKF